MELLEAIKIVLDSIGDTPSQRFSELKLQIEGKKIKEITENIKDINHESFKAAKIIKESKSQINETVHAIGIIILLPKILDKQEKVESVSLAAGSDRSGFDLVTDKRVAEFKFGKSPKEQLIGYRRRTFYSDYLCLLMNIDKNDKTQYFYLYQPHLFIKFIKGKSQWKNVLKKNLSLMNRFENFLKRHNSNASTVKEVYDEFDNGSIIIEDINSLLR